MVLIETYFDIVTVLSRGVSLYVEPYIGESQCKYGDIPYRDECFMIGYTGSQLGV